MTFRKLFLVTAVSLLISNCQSQDPDGNSREFNRISFFQRPLPSESQLLEDMIRDADRYILQSMPPTRKRNDETNDISELNYDHTFRMPGPTQSTTLPTLVHPQNGKRVSKGSSKELNMEDKSINLLMDLIKHGKWPCYCIDFERDQKQT